MERERIKINPQLLLNEVVFIFIIFLKKQSILSAYVPNFVIDWSVTTVRSSLSGIYRYGSLLSTDYKDLVIDRGLIDRS